MKSVAIEAQCKTPMTPLLKQGSCGSADCSECITRPKHRWSVSETLHTTTVKGGWLRWAFGVALKSLNELLTMQLIGAEQAQTQNLVFAQIFAVVCQKLIGKNQVGIAIF